MNADDTNQTTIMKRIRFCAGHRLLNHGGSCENLHGHNYVAEIYVTGDKVDSIGRIVDFGVINGLFKAWIDQHWDHAMLVWESDSEAISALTSIHPNRVYVMPWNPTAENMARYLAEKIGPELLAQIDDYDVRIAKVGIWETENSLAEVSIPVAGDSPQETRQAARIVGVPDQID